MDKINVNPGFIRLIKAVILVFFLIHLMTCLWFLSSVMQDAKCWIDINGLGDRSSGMQYLVSTYWAFQAITTVGYGDMSPVLI